MTRASWSVVLGIHVLLAAAACGGKAAPQPPSEPIAADPVEIEDDPGEDDGMRCQDVATHVGAFLEPGARAEVALIECAGDPIAPHGEEAAEQGFVETPMRASLEARVAGEVVLAHELASWTNGWEWGGRWVLDGMLLGGDGHTDALVLTAGSYSEAGSADQVFIVSLAGSRYDVLWSGDGGDARVQLSKDATEVVVTFTEHSYDDPLGGDTRTVHLRYRGGAVHELRREP